MAPACSICGGVRLVSLIFTFVCTLFFARPVKFNLCRTGSVVEARRTDECPIDLSFRHIDLTIENGLVGICRTEWHPVGNNSAAKWCFKYGFKYECSLEISLFRTKISLGRNLKPSTLCIIENCAEMAWRIEIGKTGPVY